MSTGQDALHADQAAFKQRQQQSVNETSAQLQAVEARNLQLTNAEAALKTQQAIVEDRFSKLTEAEAVMKESEAVIEDSTARLSHAEAALRAKQAALKARDLHLTDAEAALKVKQAASEDSANKVTERRLQGLTSQHCCQRGGIQ